ncbi:molecular chaperone DnaJ, partial [Klebsiella pneumoniae subsp. pneumoniae]
MQAGMAGAGGAGRGGVFGHRFLGGDQFNPRGGGGGGRPPPPPAPRYGGG